MSREQIFTASLDFFLAPVRDALNDPQVTEIMINGASEIYLERGGRLFRTEYQFPHEDALRAAVCNIAQYVGREISEQRPILDARLPDGSRVHAVLPPASRNGILLSIRKFRRDVFTLDQLCRIGSLSPIAAEFLGVCVRLRKNIVVSGGTGSGKTTFLNALSTAIPPDDRIVVIEDSSELRLAQPHTLYLETRPADASGRHAISIRQLFAASLRMRPDRIIVGEVRGGEALDMVQSMLSGHSGGMTSIHANQPRDALIRLETLSLMSDVELPVYVARAQAAAAIHLIVQIARFSEDGSRRVTRITEQTGLDAQNNYQFNELFVATNQGRAADGRLRMSLAPTGNRPTFANEAREAGLGAVTNLSKALWEA